MTGDGLGWAGIGGFMAGTLIATERGELPVEKLRAGMRVVILGGDVVSITWVARRDLAPRRHPRPGAIQPVRLMRDCITDGVPAGDLIVGPGQALFLAGVPIAARHLLNGASVVVEPSWSVIEYFHLGLAGSGQLLAEHVPASDGHRAQDRIAFGIDGIFTLHPGMHETEAQPPVLADAVRRLLLRRALDRGITVLPDPDLRPPGPSSHG
jgi:hypothetical protein